VVGFAAALAAVASSLEPKADAFALQMLFVHDMFNL